MSVRTVITDAEVEDRHVSVVIEDDTIIDVTEASVDGGDLEVDAAGGALIPGLHDHHVHLLAMAARVSGVDLDGIGDAGEFDRVLSLAAASGETSWVRASGYDEHRHGPLDRFRLDAIVGRRRVRVQHRSGLAWVLSSAALDEVLVGDLPSGVERDEDGRPTGRLLRLDSWLAERIGVEPPAVAGVGSMLSRFGITGVTDATPELGAGRMELLQRAAGDGVLPQKLVLLGVSDDDDLGDWASAGPWKIVIDEVTGLDPDRIAGVIAAHHRSGRAVAIHAVSRAETVTAVTALALAGAVAGDRIEHGSILPPDLDPILADGGVTVIVQPALVAERGDHYVDAVEPEDRPHLHRAASLLAAGVRVAAGSDAPVTSIDPWAAIAAASTRMTRSGRVLGADERVDAATALGWFLSDPHDPGGQSRRVRTGARADLCLLDAPLADVLADPRNDRVCMTWVGGRLVHR